jgi:DNA primase
MGFLLIFIRSVWRTKGKLSYFLLKGFVRKFMSSFDYGLVSRIQQANDIVDLIGEYVSLKKKGREMVGLCPFHTDHRPSMYVNPAKQIFKCFACGAGGDCLKFIQMQENLSFPQALQRLADRAGIKIPARPIDTRQSSIDEPDIDPNRLAAANAWAAQHFQDNLNHPQKGKFASDYLAERKIEPPVAKKWQLGLALPDDDLAKTAVAKKASVDFLVKAGLLLNHNKDKFSNRLIFPITDATGRIIAFGGRTLDQSDPKYLNTSNTVLFDKSNCLYGLEHARHSIVSSATAVVVEGYTDCIMAHAKGVSNVVATMGTSLTAGHARLLKRFAKSVVLMFDSDTAGHAAANRALEICISHQIDIKLAFVPQGKDPCDYLISAGKEKFQLLIDNAVEVFKFIWDRLTQNLDKTDSLADNKAAIEEFLQTVAAALHAGSVSPIDRGLLVNRLSKIIGLNSSQINAELGKRMKSAATAAAYNLENQKVVSIDWGAGGFAAAQRQVLEVLLNEPKLLDDVVKKISPQDFDVPLLKLAAQVVFDALKHNPDSSLTEILARTDSVEVANAIVQLQDIGLKKGNFHASLIGAIEAMQSYLSQSKNEKPVKIMDETEYLKQVHQKTRKVNRRNVGMV